MGIKGSYPHCPQGWKAGAGSIHFFRCICYYMRTGNDGTGKDKMTYKDSFKIDVTLVANEFLDKYMPGANGDYVKVYLYGSGTAAGASMWLRLQRSWSLRRETCAVP